MTLRTIPDWDKRIAECERRIAECERQLILAVGDEEGLKRWTYQRKIAAAKRTVIQNLPLPLEPKGNPS